jgi:hypothetical protein
MFCFSFVFQDCVSTKLDDKVTFPLQGLNILPNTSLYDLYACVCHIGGKHNQTFHNPNLFIQFERLIFWIELRKNMLIEFVAREYAISSAIVRINSRGHDSIFFLGQKPYNSFEMATYSGSYFKPCTNV